MSHRYEVEYTDTSGGVPNYSWVRRHTVSMPELTHYGYDGSSNYAKANRTAMRELMRRCKALVGLTGVRGSTHYHSDGLSFYPRGMATVLFANWIDE